MMMSTSSDAHVFKSLPEILVWTGCLVHINVLEGRSFETHMICDPCSLEGGGEGAAALSIY